TALALYYLWLTGELMTHHRQGFERVYDFRERVAPPQLQYEATEADVPPFFARKVLAFRGLSTERAWAAELGGFTGRKLDRADARRLLDELIAGGEVATALVEADREPRYLLAADAPLLAAVEAGRVPDAWQPLETTTEEEAVF